MKGLTLIVLLSCISVNHLSSGQLVLDGLTKEMKENFRNGFKSAPSLVQFINIDAHTSEKLEETILDYETNVLDQALGEVLVHAFTQVNASRHPDAITLFKDATSVFQVKEVMKKMHLQEPNAVKSIAMLLRTRYVPRELLQSVKSVTPSQLQTFVEASFNDTTSSSLTRSRRSVTAIIGAVITARDPSCFVYNLASTAGITRDAITKFVQEKAPGWMQKRIFNTMLTKGLQYLSTFMRVVCKVSETKPQLTYSIVNDVSDEGIEILDRVLNQTKEAASKQKKEQIKGGKIMLMDSSLSPFCSLSSLSQDKGVSSEHIQDLIRKYWRRDEKLSQELLTQLESDGVEGICLVSSLACQLTSPSSALLLNNDVTVYDDIRVKGGETTPYGLHIPVRLLGPAFCALWRFASTQGTTRNGVISFINGKFPQPWKQHLLGQLALRGIIGVVDVAGEMCGVRRMTNILAVHSSKGKELDLTNSHHVLSLSEWLNHAINEGLEDATSSIDKLRTAFLELLADDKK